jgi:hypothetical protein
MVSRSDLHPSVQAALTLLLRHGRLTSTYRSLAEQRTLYDRYRRGQSPWPAVPPGRSTHHTGLAFDLVARTAQTQTELGRYWESIGGVWGGRFGDDVHFEHPAARAALARGLTSRKWWTRS